MMKSGALLGALGVSGFLLDAIGNRHATHMILPMYIIHVRFHSLTPNSPNV